MDRSYKRGGMHSSNRYRSRGGGYQNNGYRNDYQNNGYYHNPSHNQPHQQYYPTYTENYNQGYNQQHHQGYQNFQHKPSYDYNPRYSSPSQNHYYNQPTNTNDNYNRHNDIYLRNDHSTTENLVPSNVTTLSSKQIYVEETKHPEDFNKVEKEPKLELETHLPVLKPEPGGVKKKSLMNFKKKKSVKKATALKKSLILEDLGKEKEITNTGAPSHSITETNEDDLDQLLEALESKQPKHMLNSQFEISDEEMGAEIDENENDELLRLMMNKKEKEMPQHDIQTYPIHKEFYIECEFINALSDSDVKHLRENDLIHVRGKNTTKPILEWNQLGLPSTISTVLEAMDFDSPTPIQCEALPNIMSGSDFIGIAKTGSGKTMAFLLPMFRQILSNPLPHTIKFQGSTPRSVIITPTRELAIQIAKAAKPFSDNLGLDIVKCYGGQSISNQIADLKRKADVIIGTPGRIIDLLCTNNGKILDLSYVSYFVMDEADRMLDLGFEPQILKIMELLRKDRQNVFFSATFPPKMQSIARKYANNHVEVVVGSRNAVNDNIDQKFEVLEGEDSKFSKLLQVLGTVYDQDKGKIIIFVERQNSCDHIVKQLLKRGYPVMALHGGKDQMEREGTIKDFKNGIIDIIVATSIASRGLDVDNLNLVINYDSPSHIEDYVHRVGRTGRAGKKGNAITFITPDQERLAFDLVRILNTAKKEAPEELKEIAKTYEEKMKTGEVKIGSGFGGKGGLKKLQMIRENNFNLEKRVYLEGEGVKTEDMKSVDSEKNKKITLIPVEFMPKNEKENIYSAKLFINDFSQKVRSEITSREQYSRVVEITNASVTTRGCFYPPGTNKKQSEEDKLHVLVESPSERVVAEAISLFEESARRGLEKEAMSQ